MVSQIRGTGKLYLSQAVSVYLWGWEKMMGLGYGCCVVLSVWGSRGESVVHEGCQCFAVQVW